MEVLTNVMEEEMGDKITEDALSMFVSSMGLELAKVAVKNFMDVENYILFSVGKIGTGKDERIISIGVMNHVFTASKEDIFRQLEEEGGNINNHRDTAK